jgi:hypothetical protein
MCNYKWKQNSTELMGEVYPVLYATSEGIYECTVNVMDKMASLTFKVSGR